MHFLYCIYTINSVYYIHKIKKGATQSSKGKNIMMITDKKELLKIAKEIEEHRKNIGMQFIVDPTNAVNNGDYLIATSPKDIVDTLKIHFHGNYCYAYTWDVK